MTDESQTTESETERSWKSYVPLVVLVTLVVLSATARQFPEDVWRLGSWMHDFMGGFLVVFSMLKLFDLPGFADGFQMYDLLAKPFRPYALLYPFLELSLGLAYLSRCAPDLVYIATIVLLSFGAIGVFRSLSKGMDIQCACMGTVLNVPLSTVAVVEDLGMVLMACAMLWMG